MVKSFELGPYKWKVKSYKRLEDNKMGDTLPNKPMIVLSKTYLDDNDIECEVSADMNEHTFYHELTHAILITLNHPLAYNEQFVDSFSMLLTQFEKTKK